MTLDAKLGPAPAEPQVAARNKALLDVLPFANRDDFTDSERGFVATIPDAEILVASGRPVWSLKPYAFISDNPAPDTVNPSLWRIAQLNCRHGLSRAVLRARPSRAWQRACATY